MKKNVIIVLVFLLLVVLLFTNTATDGGFMPGIAQKEYTCLGKFVTISDNSMHDALRTRFCFGLLKNTISN